MLRAVFVRKGDSAPEDLLRRSLAMPDSTRIMTDQNRRMTASHVILGEWKKKTKKKTKMKTKRKTKKKTETKKKKN